MSATTFFILALQILFIGLRMTNNINWSWWLVMLPLIIVVVMGTISSIITHIHNKKQQEIEAERRRSGKSGKFLKLLQEAMDQKKYGNHE